MVNLLLNVMVAVFRIVGLWAARSQNEPAELAEAVIGDIVYGLLNTPRFKRFWRFAGCPHLTIRVNPADVIDISGGRGYRVSARITTVSAGLT